jgi:hypothetical protein
LPLHGATGTCFSPDTKYRDQDDSQFAFVYRPHAWSRLKSGGIVATGPVRAEAKLSAHRIAHKICIEIPMQGMDIA